MTTKPKKVSKVRATTPSPASPRPSTPAAASLSRQAIASQPSRADVAQLVNHYEALRDGDWLYLADGSEDVTALFSLAVEEAIALEDLAKSTANATVEAVEAVGGKRTQPAELYEARLNALVRVLGGVRLSDPDIVLRNDAAKGPTEILTEGLTEGKAWEWAIAALTHLLAETVSKRAGEASAIAWLTLVRIAPAQAMSVYANATKLATSELAATCANTALAYVLERGEFDLVPNIAVQLELAAADSALDDGARAECAETLARIYLGSTQPEQALPWAAMAEQIYRKLSRQSKLVEAFAMLSECYLRCKQPDSALSVANERVTIAYELLKLDPSDEFAQVRAADADQALAYVRSLRKPRNTRAKA